MRQTKETPPAAAQAESQADAEAGVDGVSHEISNDVREKLNKTN